MFGRKNADFEREPRMWIFMRIEMVNIFEKRDDEYIVSEWV